MDLEPAPERYLSLLREDGERLAAVATRDLDASVPPCPGWTVRDVVVHTGHVYLHKIANMATMGPAEFPPEPAATGDAVEWFRGAHARLLHELGTRGPSAPSYTWWKPDQTVGFWYRRMAQETAVHRVDAETALDQLSPVADDLAVDGVDEVLRRFLGHDMWRDLSPEEWGGVDAHAGEGQSVGVRTGGWSWQVELHPGRIDVTDGTDFADAVVTGEPSEVLLWLWGRRPDPVVHVDGDARVVTALRDRLTVATQ